MAIDRVMQHLKLGEEPMSTKARRIERQRGQPVGLYVHESRGAANHNTPKKGKP